MVSFIKYVGIKTSFSLDTELESTFVSLTKLQDE